MNKLLHHAQTFYRVIQHDIATLTPLRIIEMIAVLVVLLQLSVVLFNVINRNSPIIGLRLDGQQVGLFGSDYQQRIHRVALSREDVALVIKASNYTATLTPRQLGATIDEKQLAKTMLQQGRTGNLFKQLFDQDAALFGHVNVSSHLQQPDQHLVTAYAAVIDSKIDTRPTNAYFDFVDQKVIIHNDIAGITLNNTQTLKDIAQAVVSDQPHTTLSLPIVQSQATVTSAMLAPLTPQVQSIAKQPLTITAGSGATTLSQQQLVGLVVPKVIPNPSDANKPLVQVSFDTTKLNAIVDGVVAPVVAAPQPAVVSHGKVIRPGVSGLQPQDDHPITSVLSALLQRQTGSAAPTTVQVPMVTIEPPTVPAAAVPTPSGTQIKGHGTGIVYLTFDDGPGQYTEQVLDILKRYNVHATFYLIGRNTQGHPQSVARMVKEGHTLGNHSFTHRDLTTLTATEVLTELTTTQQAIKQASDVTPVHFRPPYGAQNQIVKNQAASLGLSDDLWSVDPRDWSQPGSSIITQRVLSQTGAGSVVLLHVLHQQTVDALPAIIEGIRAEGYTLL